MIEIKNIEEMNSKLRDKNLSANLIEDITQQLTIIQNEFPADNHCKVLIMEDYEVYDNNGLCVEIEEVIDGYIKQIYIIDNAGDGIVVYSPKARNIDEKQS